MANKNTVRINNIIGIVLIGVIMFGFVFYQSKQLEKQQKAQAVLDSIARAEKAVQDSINAANSVVINATDSTMKVAQLPKPVVVYKDAELTKARSGQDTIVCLQNEKLKVEFTTKGAQPYSVEVLDYKKHDSTDLYLIPRKHSQLNLQLYIGETINTKDFSYQIAEHTDSTLSMRLMLSNGGYVENKYTLSPDSYVVKSETNLVNLNLPRNVNNTDIDWNVIIPRLERGYKNEKQYSKIAYYFTDEKSPEEMAKGKNESKNVDVKFKWFAIQQQFFSAIMTAENEFQSANFDVKFFDESDENKNLMSCQTRMRSELYETENGKSFSYEFYFGPNHFKTLKAFDRKYEKIIPLGGSLVSWISRFFIIPCFNFLGKFIQSYGIIILIMTILLKILIFPLTLNSYKSSAKMSVLKPEIDKINQKYPKQEDMMKKQQATMDLYQRAGIKPLGGCLPMLLQFPILWAMFRFFPASIELRQKSFLWADDLSTYDSILDLGFNIPLYGDHISLFAILMALSMFAYSKMTSSQMSSDPQMASMKFMTVWMMPIMMLFICNNLSSGLSYYYFLSNLITMLQTFVIKKWIVTPSKVLAQLEASKNKPKPKSKWQMRLEEMQKQQRQMMQQQQKNRK